MDHTCTADCYAHGIRYGFASGCDPFAAEAAASAAWEASPDGIIAAAGIWH